MAVTAAGYLARSVGVATVLWAGRLMNRGSILGGARDIYFHHCFQTGSEAHRVPCPICIVALTAGNKMARA
jgi:hypothetical protein